MYLKEIKKWELKKKVNNININEIIDEEYKEKKIKTLILNIDKDKIKIKNIEHNNLNLEYNNLEKKFSWLLDISLYCKLKKPTIKSLLKKIEKLYLINNGTNNQVIKEVPLIDNFELYYINLKKKVFKQIENDNKNIINKKNESLYDINTIAGILLKEFINIKNNLCKKINIELLIPNNDIFMWKILFKKFSNNKINDSLNILNSKYNYNYIEINLSFHKELYPNYPPSIKCIRPRLKNSLIHKLSNLRMVDLDYWTVGRGIDYIIKKLYNILNEFAIIDDSYLNNTKYEDGAYNQLENELVNLASLSGGDKVDTLELDKTEYIKVKNILNIKNTNNKNNKKNPWKKGTGYGNSNTSNWDIKKYIKSQKEKEIKTNESLFIIKNLIEKNEDSKENIIEIINNSVLIDCITSYLRGGSLLEFSKHRDMYELILSILDIIIKKCDKDSDKIFIKNNSKIPLVNIIDNLNKKIEQTQIINKKSLDISFNNNEIREMFKKFKELTELKSFDVEIFKRLVSKICLVDKPKELNLEDPLILIKDIKTKPTYLTGFSFKKIVDLVTEMKKNKLNEVLCEDKNNQDDDKINKYIIAINEYFTNKLQNIVEKVSIKSIEHSNYNEYQHMFKDRIFSIESSIAGENNYYYKKNLKNILPNRKYIRRMQKEWSILYELPIHYNSSIFARADQNHVSCMKVMITGPDDTPYDSGIFIFDVLIPSDYPMNPPKVIFKNTGGKRFNPNLYNCGKVCLSLLGTWSGDSNEKWIPSESTLNQIFISIQAQIFIKEPYFNEPGYEREMNTNEGKKSSFNYNKRIRLYTMEHAIKDMIESPEKVFKDEIIDHFKLKKDYIKRIIKNWTFDENLKTSEKNRYIALSNEINSLLDSIDKLNKDKLSNKYVTNVNALD